MIGGDLIGLMSLAIPIVIGYIVEGVNVDHNDVTNWIAILYAKTDDDTGSSVSSYQPEKASRTTLEIASLPDVGPIFEPFDPEVQALLAYE